MTIEEGLKLGLSLLKEFLKNEFDVDRVDAGYVDLKDKRFKKLSMDDLKKLIK